MTGDPYRTSAAPTPVKHVCLSCMISFTDGPSECRRCELMRLPLDVDEVYQALLAEGHRRIKRSRWGFFRSIDSWPPTNDAYGEPWTPHLDPPKDGRAIEALTRDELVAWLGLRKL